MGYKLAGYDVIGCNEIDPRMNKCYVENHHPKYNFLCDIREMVKAVDLPAELYNLDVLDGPPPCSTFSMAGSREDAWGVEKKFFNYNFLYDDQVAPTLAAHIESIVHYDEPKFTSTAEVNKISIFPMDYDYCGMSPHYICGMSMPPVMMAQVASRVYEQWLSKL